MDIFYNNYKKCLKSLNAYKQTKEDFKVLRKESAVMGEGFLNFGDFIARKREQKRITLREMAKLLEITAPYLSDVEKDRRNPFDMDKLQKLNSILELSDEEMDLMLDLAGEKRNDIAPDLRSYIKQDHNITLALRTARNKKISSETWSEFIKMLNEE